MKQFCLVFFLCAFLKGDKGGKLYPAFFSTLGEATVSRQWAEVGDEIAAQLVEVNRGTCTVKKC